MHKPDTLLNWLQSREIILYFFLQSMEGSRYNADGDLDDRRRMMLGTGGDNHSMRTERTVSSRRVVGGARSGYR